MQGKAIVPVHWKKSSRIEDIVNALGSTCFEARKVAEAAELFKTMIKEGDTIWLGIAGAGIVGGLGGYVIDLVEYGFVDAICSTGAQVYHDSHFAYNLPVVQGSPHVNDNELDKDGTTRIYDINIRLKETLIAQDEHFQRFARTNANKLKSLSTADWTYEWGKYINENSPYPESSFVSVAAKNKVPVFWDSESNHSIAMNNAFILLKDNLDIAPNPSLSLLEAAAIVYFSKQSGFFELGGGGPKNWIQTLSPMISQILKRDFEGADRGIQITTAPEYDGGLSGCTFNEGVSWGKYKDATKGLVQIHSDYSIVFPLLAGYVLESCKPREQKRLMEKKKEYFEKLKEEMKIPQDR